MKIQIVCDIDLLNIKINGYYTNTHITLSWYLKKIVRIFQDVTVVRLGTR